MRNLLTIFLILELSFGYSQTGNKSADLLFDKMWYIEAAKAYEAAIEKGDISKETLQRVGDCYYFNTRMEEASKWYGKLVAQYTEVPPEYLFRYAQALEGVENYELAKKWMKIFAEKNSDSRAENFSQEQKTIEEVLLLKPQFTLQNLDINSSYSDFGPMFYKDMLVYATTIDSSYFKTHNYGWNDQPYLNLQIGSISPSQTDVTRMGRFSDDLTTKYHEACIAFSPDGNTIYFTRNNYQGKLKRDAKGVNNLKLYSAAAKGEISGKTKWEDIKELPFNSDAYSVGQPAVSKDGKKLYFISDMPGTIGGTDIFVVDIKGNNKFSEPKNLGAKINTPGREMFPFVTDKALYFSSDGYLGLGALDVFESKINNSIFQLPENLGAPLNSSMDDFGYIVNEETNKGFVCSNRKTGKGDDDIYSFERTPIICKQSIKGTVSNSITGERISGTTVKLYTMDGKIIEETITQVNGEYLFKITLDCASQYLVQASKRGFKDNAKLIITANLSGETIVPLGMDPELIVRENGLLKIKIDIIFFDLDKSVVRNDAAIELNKVVLLLNEYPNMIIKIESHTDSRAKDSYNLQLSDQRAKATRDYILSQGISPERIESAKGYGETQLTNECSNGVPCTETRHQMNRRSEFIILKI